MARAGSGGSGGDLRDFSLQPLPWRNKLIRRERDVWGRLLRHRCITVALVHGHVAGSGLELALYCDLRLATPDSQWRLPETGVGMIPGAGGTQLLPRLARPARAMEMMLLGSAIDGRTAHRWGLAQSVIEAQPFRAAAQAWLTVHVEPPLGCGDSAATEPDTTMPAAAAVALTAPPRPGAQPPLAAGLLLDRRPAARRP